MDKLTKTPAVWFAECTYCNANDFGQNGTRLHELELLAKARKLCKNHDKYHLDAYVTSELDLLDHSLLTELGQTEILTAIHDKTGCDCLTAAIDTVLCDVQSPIPDNHLIHPKSPSSGQITQTPTNPSSRTNHHKPPRPRSLLDRLKAGPRSTPS